MQATLRPATVRDLTAIEAMLASFSLPTAGVSDHIGEFVVAEDGGRIVAAAGIELYGESALLRSVAVDDHYRGQGLARELVRNRLDNARRAGVRDVFLLTSTARDYFARLGFSTIPDTSIHAAVRVSKEFGDCCCASAEAMQLILEGDR